MRYGAASVDIEYTGIKEGGLTIHVAWVDNEPSNRNQYFFDIEGLTSYNRGAATIGIHGDWEYQAFIECLSEAREYIMAGAKAQKKMFISSNILNISLLISHKYDAPDKIRLKFTFDDYYCQPPVINGAVWPGIKKTDFAFYTSLEELKSISNAIERMNNGDISISPIGSCLDEAWIRPTELHPERMANVFYNNAVARRVVEMISDHDPTVIQDSWVNLIKKGCIFRFNEATCPTCDGYFVQEANWMKECLGCYRGNAPTATPKMGLDNVRIQPWLVSFSDKIDDEEEDHAINVFT